MKVGFATIIGRSNVGKSTLLNTLVGTKVAITTPKPQTTRQPVHGVMTLLNEGQIVFVDTPGIMQKAKDALTKKLLQWTKQALKDVNAIIYVADSTRAIGSEEKQVLRLLENIEGIPKLLFINKTDDRKSRDFIDVYRDLSEQFDAVVEGSAMTGKNTGEIKDWALAQMDESEDYLYPDFNVTNMTREHQVAEIIREKLFLRLRQEVPYSTHVEVEGIKEHEDGSLGICATIYTHSDRYKGMIIGAQGRGVKEINNSVVKELEGISSRKVHLQLEVQTDRNWLRRLGE